MSDVLEFDPDAAIVRRLAQGASQGSRAGREAALAELMARHSGKLHGLAARMLGDAALAEDIVQETFLKAWTKAEDWEPGRATFGTWLGRITVNSCLDRLRRTRPLTGVDLPDRADPAAPADAAMIAQERQARIRAAMNALPERQNAALALSLSGLNQVEGAAALDITQGAYESLLVRARRGLRTKLTEEMTHAV